jgi:hypothetical protein
MAPAARLKVVLPGKGRDSGLVPGIGVIFKIDGEDSGGALSIVEHPFAVGSLGRGAAHVASTVSTTRWNPTEETAWWTPSRTRGPSWAGVRFTKRS